VKRGRTVEVELVVALRLPDGAPVPVETLIAALTERFPWVEGVIVEATTDYAEEVTR
jgi:hypothetical protein